MNEEIKVIATDLSTLMSQATKKRVVVKKKTVSKKESLVSDQNLIPFTKKYAPKKLEDVQDQAEVVQTIIRYTKNVPESAYSMPHMLFFGPSGVGKTTLVNLAVLKLFPNKDVRKENVLKLNASDERGINTVRTSIKDFIVVEPSSRAPFRLVILDECDNMTDIAQFALRRMMEPDVSVAEKNKPRFFLMCNYVSKVIPPLTSRCHVVRFSKVDGNAMCLYLKNIFDKENWKKNDPVIEEIVRVSEGDMRKALTLTQSVYKLWGDFARPEHVADAAGHIPDPLVSSLLDIVLDSTKSIQCIISTCKKLVLRQAYSGDSILKQMVSKVVQDDRISEIARCMSCEKMAQSEYAMKKHADDYLQVVSCMIHLRSQVKKNPLTTETLSKFRIKLKPLSFDW